MTTVNYRGTSRPPTEGELTAVAAGIGVETAALKAVIEVETAGRAYYGDGSLTMLYEPHIAYRYAPDAGTRTALVNARVATIYAGMIAYPGKAVDRYAQFNKCAQIAGPELACMSCSWGWPQGMGFNHRAFGYSTAVAMVEAFAAGGETEQVKAMARFITANGTMLSALRQKRWAVFARLYNGSAYRKNRYDEKLANAYMKHNKELSVFSRVLRFGDKSAEVRTLQTMLVAVGFELEPDGHFGKITRAAVEALQWRNGLKVDGVFGPASAAALTKEMKGV